MLVYRYRHDVIFQYFLDAGAEGLPLYKPSTIWSYQIEMMRCACRQIIANITVAKEKSQVYCGISSFKTSKYRS